MDSLLILGIGLFIAGFILVGIEMVIPGFGAPGLGGIACLILAIVITADTVEEGMTITMIVVAVLAVMLTVVMLVLKQVKSPVILEENLKSDSGFLNESDLEYLIGKEGVTVTDLKPVGKCSIEGIEFDVRAENRILVKDSRVVVSAIHENIIMVRAK
ncbi:MAG: serine protease [Lachnospiraceae bacterium]|nr:serine protease [Lachnospiraceae bacterium]